MIDQDCAIAKVGRHNGSEGRTRLYKLMCCIKYGGVGAVVNFDLFSALLFVFGVNIIFSLLSV